MRLRGWSLRWLCFVLTSTVVLTGIRGVKAEKVSSDVASEARLQRDVTFLASDACEGRGVTTEGIQKAADYIAGEFRKIGLKPGGIDGTYFQPFTIPGAILKEPATLTLHGPHGRALVLKQGSDFYPMGIGHAGVVNGLPVVFAGFGISNEKSPEYDDYADLDVADKVVIVFRDAPRPKATGDSAFAGRERRQVLASFSDKIATAKKHHAAAILFVNDAATAADGDDLLDFNYTALAASRADIPILHVHRSLLETMLPGGIDELHRIEHDIERELKPRSRALKGWSVDLTVKMSRGKVALKNVIGVLEGSGNLAQETVVIGAHYDHLGYGNIFGRGTSSFSGSKKMIIHHGADDNASGTTAMMELARRFAFVPHGQRRRLVFMAFSGEEINLLGSDHYTKNPIFPLADTTVMINLDMVGRLCPDKETHKDRLHVQGTGTAKMFDALLNEVNKKYDFKLIKQAGGYGFSDHTSFSMKKIPVLFCWTDLHDDYHRPSDTADKINIPGMRKVTDFVNELITRLATVEQRPVYIEANEDASPQTTMSVPRLGILPNYSDTEDDKGVLLANVHSDGPAGRAGLKTGDRIVEIAGKPVKNLTSYMSVMSVQKKTGTLELIILREGKRLPMKVHLD